MSFFSKLFVPKPPVPAPAPAPPPLPKAPKPDRSAEFAAEDDRLTAAIEAADAAAIASFVTDGGSTRVRQRAAEAVTDPARVRDLIRAARGKDNAVYRILTAKRDAWLTVERAAAALTAELDAVAASIARHARLPFDAIYAATLAEQEKRWEPLADKAPEAQRHAVAADLARAHAVVDGHAARLAEVARRTAEAAAAAAGRAAAADAAERAQDEWASAEAARRAAERAEEDARQDAQNATVRELVGLLRQLQAALDRGGSARAARLREQLVPKLEAAAGTALPSWFQRQLAEADEALARLKDWHDFTVGPKRVELTARMQSLVGAEIAPEQLAVHIRRLQDEWRTLHRGAGEDDSAETAQFKAIANQAYEPCKVHFAAQAAQRAENRAQREAILEALTAFAADLEGEAPNWRRVLPALGEARREWRQYAPVDQEVAAELQARFKAGLERVVALLSAEHERNVAAKRALIDAAAALVTREDVREAIDSAKALQRQWKLIGVVPREQDNPLWEEFRGHCNAVFERSAQEAAAFSAALAAAATRAEALLADLERIATLAGDELREALKSTEALSQEFETLELPRAQARALRQRFHQGLEACQDALQADRERAAAEAWNRLYTTAGRIRAFGWARHTGADAETLAALALEVDAAVASLAGAPKVARTAVERQWSRVRTSDETVDGAAHEAALRLVCIRAELATDTDTPVEDQARRRDYQMRRLLESKNLGQDLEPLRMEDLALEWVTVGPTDPAVETGLVARLQRCRDVAARRRRTAD